MSGPVRTTSPVLSALAPLVASLVSLVVAVGLVPPASAAPPRALAGSLVPHAADPGSGFGYGFDTCDAPSQRSMNAWNQHSHFSAVGIYIAGMNRACSSQRHLDRGWVRTQKARGWKLLPLVVGRQASCASATASVKYGTVSRFSRSGCSA